MKQFIKLMGLVALGLSATLSAQAKSVDVFACEPEWAALSQEIGGERVKVYTATTAFEDPHHVRARPSHLAAMRRADLVFCSGAGLEDAWLPLLIKKGASKIQPGSIGNLMASDWVTKIEVPRVVDRSLGDIHAAGNPHVHLDPRNLLPISRQLTKRLSKIDPGGALIYAERQKRFERDWSAQIIKWQSQAAKLENKGVVAHHRSFSYLFNWLGVNTAATLEPKPGVSPSGSDLAKAAAELKDRRVVAVVRTPYEPKKPAAWAAKSSGKSALVLPYTVGGDPKATDLKSLFDLTITRLLEANR